MNEHMFTNTDKYVILLWCTMDESFLDVGTIEGKSDCGYFNSVKFGRETYQGVMYHTDNGSCWIVIPHTPPDLAPSSKERRIADDIDRPKQNMSDYNFFSARGIPLSCIWSRREKWSSLRWLIILGNLPDDQKHITITSYILTKWFIWS